MSLGSNWLDWVRSFWKIPTRLHGTNLCINSTSLARLHLVSCSNETIQNAPKHYKTHQYMSLGFNGVDQVRSLRKFLCDFMARNCALIAQVQPILHRVSCSNKILPNTPKHYETHQNMSLGFNGVDWVRSLRKIVMRLHGTNFYINCTSSTRFAPSFV